MKTKTDRRSFLKQGALLGGGLLLLGAEGQAAGAAETGINATEGSVAPANETLKTIGRLRTIHGNFMDKPIPEPELQTILNASVRAANASNMQSHSIVVVKDRKTMGEVCGYRGGCMLLYWTGTSRIGWAIPNRRRRKLRCCGF